MTYYIFTLYLTIFVSIFIDFVPNNYVLPKLLRNELLKPEKIYTSWSQNLKVVFEGGE